MFWLIWLKFKLCYVYVYVYEFIDAPINLRNIANINVSDNHWIPQTDISLCSLFQVMERVSHPTDNYFIRSSSSPS